MAARAAATAVRRRRRRRENAAGAGPFMAERNPRLKPEGEGEMIIREQRGPLRHELGLLSKFRIWNWKMVVGRACKVEVRTFWTNTICEEKHFYCIDKIALVFNPI